MEMSFSKVKRREYSYNGELMRKATPIEDLFQKTQEMKGRKVEVRRNNIDEKIDYIVRSQSEDGEKSVDVKNDIHFGETGNVILEWEYLFFKTRTIHRCWGHPECENPKANWLAFYRKTTHEFWIYSTEEYLKGFWKAIEDNKAWIHIESSDDRKSTINWIFPEDYVKPVAKERAWEKVHA